MVWTQIQPVMGITAWNTPKVPAMMYIRFTDILGSCRPFAIETENASMARPTPSRALLRKNKKLHSIINPPDADCGKNKTRGRCGIPHPVPGRFFQTDSMCRAWYIAPDHMSLANESKPDSRTVIVLTCCAVCKQRLLLPHGHCDFCSFYHSSKVKSRLTFFRVAAYSSSGASASGTSAAEA